MTTTHSPRGAAAPERMTVDQVLHRLDRAGFTFSASAVRRWCAGGTVRAVKLGQRWWVDRASLEAFIGGG